MSLTKHATAQVLSAQYAAEGASLMRTAHRVAFEYTPRPGYLYVRSRAISSRCNDNFDEFPAAEIASSYRTFIGKPVFVNHHNSDHRRARGVIIDAALHEDKNSDGTPDTWAEVLMEVDAVRFPKLAQAIVNGEIDRTSMGTDVAYSVCSFCGNKASTPSEYCRHIPKMKGQRIYRTTASGSKEGILVRELCYGLGFFENSLLVEEPADPTAYFLGVDASAVQGMKSTARMVPVRQHPTTSTAGASSVTITNPYATLRVQASLGRVAARVDYDGRESRYGDDVSVHGEVQQRDEVDMGDGRTQVHLTYTPDGASDPKSVSVWKKDLDKTASKTALMPGEVDVEVVAPSEVDTLRDEQCPVCGDSDSFNGEQCQVCGFIKPPDAFGDPDVDKAKEIDNEQAGAAISSLVCDSCGKEVEGSTTPAPPASQPQVPPVDVSPSTPPKTALVLDKGGDSDDQAPVRSKPSAGDSCPFCQSGTLKPKAPSSDNTASDDSASDDDYAPAGSAAATSTTDFAPAGSAGTDSKKPVVSRRTGTHVEGGDVDMRPALAAVAAQQKQIDAQGKALAYIANLAGLSDAPLVRAAALHIAADENPAIGGPITDGTTPGTESASESTEQARTPSAKDDPTKPGASPLTNVGPGATTSVSDTGTSLDSPLNLNEFDPTKIVSGSDDLGEGARGVPGSGRTEIDVRVGQPTMDTAFNDGGFLSTSSSARTMASLRLARLQIEAGVTSEADDLTLGEKIAASKDSDEKIQTQIDTLAAVAARRARPQTPAPRNLVPQAPRTATRAPSLGGDPTPLPQIVGSVSSDEMAFE